MIDDIFIFDNVIHLSDMSIGNVRDDVPGAAATREQIVRSVQGLRWPGPAPRGVADYDWARRWEVDDMYELVFEHSPTDMAMAQTVPLFDWFKDGQSPVAMQYAMAAAHPQRVMFCGGVDPMYRGLDGALEQIDYQIGELGARSFKFYNAHERLQDCWRCDDERIAYPMYERALKGGVRVLQFHKGNPWGKQNMEMLAPNDLQAPARDFPQIDFIVHHLALPYFEEMVSIAARFPNVYLSLAGFMALYRIAPRRVQDHLGRLLQACGAGKLLWGSEAALAGGPAPSLRAMVDFTIPDDLRAGYGYPQITMTDKRAILGENFARLMGVDIEQKKAQFDAARAP